MIELAKSFGNWVLCSQARSHTPHLLSMGFVLVVLFASGDVRANTQNEIDHLLEFVAQTDCQYDRNGTLYDGPEARDHIKMKYDHYRKKVKTAEDFIKYSATKSLISGEKYRIHCPESDVAYTRDWLLDELSKYRKTLQP